MANYHNMLFQFLKTQEGNQLLLFRDFTGGTLGLAWVASASGASGGICEKYKTYAENINGINHKAKRSLNTGKIFFFAYFIQEIKRKL